MKRYSAKYRSEENLLSNYAMQTDSYGPRATAVQVPPYILILEGINQKRTDYSDKFRGTLVFF